MDSDEQILALREGLSVLGTEKGERALLSLATVLKEIANPETLVFSPELKAVIAMYTELVEGRLHPQLQTFALSRGAEEFLPHTRMYAVLPAKQKASFSFRALRIPAFLSGGGENARADAQTAVEQSTAPCVAIWTTMIPTGLPGAPRESQEFKAFGYLVDSAGREAAFLCANPGGVVWMPVQGELLHAHVDALDALTTTGEFQAIRAAMVEMVVRATVRAKAPSSLLGATGVQPQGETMASLLAAVGRDPELNAELDEALTAVISAIGSDSVYFLQVLTSSIQQTFDRLDKLTAKATQDLAKTLKRRTDELARLEKAYEGLKARAARQDVQLRELRTRVSVKDESPGAEQAAESPSLQKALALLF